MERTARREETRGANWKYLLVNYCRADVGHESGGVNGWVGHLFCGEVQAISCSLPEAAGLKQSTTKEPEQRDSHELRVVDGFLGNRVGSIFAQAV